MAWLYSLTVFLILTWLWSRSIHIVIVFIMLIFFILRILGWWWSLFCLFISSLPANYLTLSLLLLLVWLILILFRFLVLNVFIDCISIHHFIIVINFKIHLKFIPKYYTLLCDLSLLSTSSPSTSSYSGFSYWTSFWSTSPSSFFSFLSTKKSYIYFSHFEANSLISDMGIIPNKDMTRLLVLWTWKTMGIKIT